MFSINLKFIIIIIYILIKTILYVNYIVMQILINVQLISFFTQVCKSLHVFQVDHTKQRLG